MNRAARSADKEICSRRFSHGSVCRSVIDQQPRVALNDGEHVVDVVRDASRQLADAFHFLRLTELRLETEPLGNIFNADDHPVHVAGGVEQWRGVR